MSPQSPLLLLMTLQQHILRLYVIVSADEGTVTVSSADEDTATPPKTHTNEAGPADRDTVTDSDGGSETVGGSS